MTRPQSHRSYALLALCGALVLSPVPFARATGGPTAGSAVATPTPTSSPPPTTTTSVVLEAGKKVVDVKESVTLTGSVVSDQVSCMSAVTIEIARQPLGSSEPGRASVATTDEAGEFATQPIRIDASAEFTATTRAVKDAECPETSSEPVTVLARVLVDILARPAQPERGSKVAISGRVSPAHPGTKVKLQKRVNGEWKPAGKTKLDSSSRFTKSYKARWKKRVFRAVWPSADADHERGKSKRVVVKTRRPRSKRGDKTR
ncbi:MAG: hypothetical protein ACRDJ2_05240 [Actinomycetota bacterium]